MNIIKLLPYYILEYIVIFIGNGNLICRLADFYNYNLIKKFNHNDYTKHFIKRMKYLYRLAVFRNNNMYAMVSLGYYYNHYEGYNKHSINKMIYLYKLAIHTHSNSTAMFYIACHYNQINKKNKMKYFCKLAIQHNNTDAMAYYGSQYIYTNYNKMKHYYNKAIINNYYDSLEIIEYLKQNDQYLLLKKIKSNKYISINIINKIKNYEIVKLYKKKYYFKNIFNIIYKKN